MKQRYWSMERKELKTLEDILLCIEEIEHFFDTRPRSFEAYLKDICLRRAIERNITIIGEAMNRLLKAKPDISIMSAKKIVGTRNYVIHGYDSVTDEIIWSIVIRHLPILKSEVKALLAEADQEGNEENARSQFTPPTSVGG